MPMFKFASMLAIAIYYIHPKLISNSILAKSRSSQLSNRFEIVHRARALCTISNRFDDWNGNGDFARFWFTMSSVSLGTSYFETIAMDINANVWFIMNDLLSWSYVYICGYRPVVNFPAHQCLAEGSSHFRWPCVHYWKLTNCLVVNRGTIRTCYHVDRLFHSLLAQPKRHPYIRALLAAATLRLCSSLWNSFKYENVCQKQVSTAGTTNYTHRYRGM